VLKSQVMAFFLFPSWTPCRPSTMARELISSTNVLSVVSGMSRISCGYGPVTLRPSYTM